MTSDVKTEEQTGVTDTGSKDESKLGQIPKSETLCEARDGGWLER